MHTLFYAVLNNISSKPQIEHKYLSIYILYTVAFTSIVLYLVPKPTEIDLVAEIKGFTYDDNKSIVEYLNKNDEKFNDQSKIIIIKRAEIGSVIIYLTLAAIQTEQQIYLDLYTFVQRLIAGIYSQIKLTTDNRAATDIMIFPNEHIQSGMELLS